MHVPRSISQMLTKANGQTPTSSRSNFLWNLLHFISVSSWSYFLRVFNLQIVLEISVLMHASSRCIFPESNKRLWPTFFESEVDSTSSPPNLSLCKSLNPFWDLNWWFSLGNTLKSSSVSPKLCFGFFFRFERSSGNSRCWSATTSLTLMARIEILLSLMESIKRQAIFR